MSHSLGSAQSLGALMNSELIKPDSVTRPQFIDGVAWTWDNNFGVLMEGRDVAAFRIVGLVGASPDLGCLGNQRKCQTDWNLTNVGQMRMNINVAYPPHGMGTEIVGHHVRVLCALGVLLKKSLVEIKSLPGRDIGRISSWDDYDAYVIGTNNIFEDLKIFRSPAPFTSAALENGSFNHLRTGPLPYKDLPREDGSDVPRYSLLDWPELQTKTQNLGPRRGMVYATNFDLEDSSGKRFPTVDLPSMLVKNTAFVSTVNAVVFMNCKKPGDKLTVTLALRIVSLKILQTPPQPVAPSKPLKQSPQSLREMLDSAKKRKAAELDLSSSTQASKKHGGVTPSTTPGPVDGAVAGPSTAMGGHPGEKALMEIDPTVLTHSGLSEYDD